MSRSDSGRLARVGPVMAGCNAMIGMQPVPCGERVALNWSRRRVYPVGVPDRGGLPDLCGRAVFEGTGDYGEGRGRPVGQIWGRFRRAWVGRGICADGSDKWVAGDMWSGEVGAGGRWSGGLPSSGPDPPASLCIFICT